MLETEPDDAPAEPTDEEIVQLLIQLAMEPSTPWRHIRIRPVKDHCFRARLSEPWPGGRVTLTAIGKDTQGKYSGWEGYEIELFGIAKTHSPQEQPFTGMGFFRWGTDTDPHYIELWHEAVYSLAGGPYAVVQWHPPFGERRAIEGLEAPHTQQAVAQARRGFDLLSKLAKSTGAPLGPRNDPLGAAYRARIVAKARKLRVDGFHWPQVAQQYEESQRTIRRWVDEADKAEEKN
jgi:hypothetical protein